MKVSRALIERTLRNAERSRNRPWRSGRRWYCRTGPKWLRRFFAWLPRRRRRRSIPAMSRTSSSITSKISRPKERCGTDYGSESPLFAPPRSSASRRLSNPHSRSGRWAGAFELSGSPLGAAIRPGPAKPDDVALILAASTPRGRKSCLWRTPTSGPRPAASQLRSSFPKTTGARQPYPCPHPRADCRSLRSAFARGGAVFCTPGFRWLKSSPTWRRPSPPGTRRCRPCAPTML